MELLNDFYSAIKNPAAYAGKLKEKGKKVVGYFCSYTPEEIIYAAGAHPMRLFSPGGEISLADNHIQSYCCSLVRGGLEGGLSGAFDFLDGTVFPHTCDSIQRLSDIWRMNMKFKFFADVILPVKLDAPSSRVYMINVLEKFRKELSEGLEVEISDGALNDAAEKYNKIRQYMKQLYQMRSENPGIISGSDMYALTRGSMVMDRDELIEKLPMIISELEKKEKVEDKRKRIILTGSICDLPDVYSLIENSGAAVVWDDLCTGTRWFQGEINIIDKPIEAIADRYMERIICPAKFKDLTSRGDNLIKMVEKQKAEGVVFLLMKFCEPHAFDYPYIKEQLEKNNIRNMLFELEDQHLSEGQLSTRIETFVNML